MMTKEAKSGPVTPIPVVSLERTNLLSAPKRPGFQRRWARNTEEDVERLEEIGYVVVKGDNDSPKTRRDMVLMEIPQAIYNERTRLKVERVKRARSAVNAKQRAAAEAERMAQQPELKGAVSVIGGISIE